MKQMRSIKQCINEIREQDPSNALSENHLRNLILSGELASHKAGRKYIFDLADLEAVLSGGARVSHIPQVEVVGDYVPNRVRRIVGE